MEKIGTITHIEKAACVGPDSQKVLVCSKGLVTEFDAEDEKRRFITYFEKDLGVFLNFKQHSLMDFIFIENGDIIGLIKSKRAYKSKQKFKSIS